MRRYEASINTLTKEEIIKLKDLKVAVIGCGGLGGYIIEELARLGVGTIKLVDDDEFSISNLNRQLMSNEENIGKSKVLEAKLRISKVNSEVTIIPFLKRFTFKNAEGILHDIDIVFDATDNIVSRIDLEEECESRNIPIIHGAINGWYGQVCIVIPGSKRLSKLYKSEDMMCQYQQLGNPSFTPPIVASIQINEFVKYLFNKGLTLTEKVLFIDLLNHEYVLTDV